MYSLPGNRPSHGARREVYTAIDFLAALPGTAVRWLPELRGAVSGLAPIEAVTIRRMLSHESGLPSEPPGTDWSVPAYRGDPGQVLRRPGDITLQLPPNFRHKYSDLAFQLLGEIVTRVTGTPFARYLTESVLARPRYLADDEWAQAWGISWCGQRAADTVWITHSGWVPGFTSSICFDPRSQVGAIVLLNAEQSGSTTELAISLAETACAAGPVQVPETDPATKASAHACQPLLGLYARPGLTHVVRVEWRDGRVAVAGPEPGGWRFPLSPTSDPEVFTIDPDSPQAGDQVRFHRTADGRVRAISLFDATFARLDPVAAG